MIGPADDRVARPAGARARLAADRALRAGRAVALALAFDPRYRDFPFAPLTAAAVPFLLLALLVPRPRGRARRWRRPPRRSCSRCARSPSSVNESARQLAGDVVLRGARRGRAQSGFGRGPRQAEDQQRDGERRQRHVVEHDAEAAGDQRDGAQHERRPDQIEQRRAERDAAEHRRREQQRSRCGGWCTARSPVRPRRRCRPPTARSPDSADRAHSRSRRARWQQATRSGAAMGRNSGRLIGHLRRSCRAGQRKASRCPSNTVGWQIAPAASVAHSRAAAAALASGPATRRSSTPPAARSRAPPRPAAALPARRRACSSPRSRAGAGLRPSWRRPRSTPNSALAALGWSCGRAARGAGCGRCVGGGSAARLDARAARWRGGGGSAASARRRAGGAGDRAGDVADVALERVERAPAAGRGRRPVRGRFRRARASSASDRRAGRAAPAAARRGCWRPPGSAGPRRSRTTRHRRQASARPAAARPQPASRDRSRMPKRRRGGANAAPRAFSAIDRFSGANQIVENVSRFAPAPLHPVRRGSRVGFFP